MQNTFDVIVAGLGAMGSAAAFHLARAGKGVLGLDRFTPPHTLGSSHGQTRIIREAYFEHPLYVPLVQRAYELWADLEQQSGQRLFHQTGGLMIGPPEGVVVQGAQRSAAEHRLKYELLSATEARQKFPALQLEPSMVAVWEPRAGVVFPELCVAAHLEQARKSGARLGLDETVESWRPEGEVVRVRTNQGEYRAKQLVLSAGGWLQTLTPELGLPLQVERQVLYWFEPNANADVFAPDRCPIYICEYARNRFFYGFPDLGHGVKVARHHEGETTSPDKVRRDVAPEEEEAMRELVRRFLPDADGRLVSATVCLYTNTPDHHFLIDRHPQFRQVLIVSPCSGHGFKFSSAIGEVIAELIVTGRSRFDLSLFALKRLGLPDTQATI